MGQVADTSLAALQREVKRLAFSPFWQRYFFRGNARGLHGVHSPLAWELSQRVWLPEVIEMPLPARLKAFFSDWAFREYSLSEIESALLFLTGKPNSVVFITGLPADRGSWLAACNDPMVNMAIDCFDCGLLLRSSAVFQKQYLRQRFAD